MKKRFLALLLTIVSIFCLILVGCGVDKPETPKQVDYAAQVKLDMTSNETIKAEAEFKLENHIDGDTTHFLMKDVMPTKDGKPVNKLKARYLAVNTPESTGKIEEWGKRASRFTKEHLAAATSIVLETNGEDWEVDSTGERYLVWVWYKTADATDYRCLNIELLQEGLAVGSKSMETRYGTICVSAIDQAVRFKLFVHSTEKDPDFYYGDALIVSIKDIALNREFYLGKRVAFDGVVTEAYNNGIYLESYDEDTGRTYGIYAYYGYDIKGTVLKTLTKPGNTWRIVGEASNQFGYQISDLNYNPYKKDDPNNIRLIEEGDVVPCAQITENDYANENYTVTWKEENEDGTVTDKSYTGKFLDIAFNTRVSMENLKVTRVSTTTNEQSSNKGAMTLTCTLNGKTISIRTGVLYDDNGDLVTAERFQNKTIDVTGIVGLYEEYNQYQILVYSVDNITIH